MRLPKGSSRAWFLLLLLALVVSVQAQHRLEPTEAQKERWQRIDETLFHAHEVAMQAREALRRRDFAGVERLAAQSILLTDGFDRENRDAHEVLAESYLTQGKLAQALVQAYDETSPLGQRFGMTKALILIGLGRRADARTLLLAELGTLAQPTDYRKRDGLEDLPIDADSSDAAVEATAYLVRATYTKNLLGPVPELVPDLKAVTRLAPTNALAHLLLAEEYLKTDLALARAEALKAQRSLDPAMRKRGDGMVAYIDAEILKKNAAGGG